MDPATGSNSNSNESEWNRCCGHESTIVAEEWSCANCNRTLEFPLIRCAACKPPVNICKSCFAMGAEFSDHENDHPYSVVKYDFSIFDNKWTAAEELKLLDAIMESGFGNWPAISARIRTKSPAECENHYIKCYVEFPKAPLPEFPDNHVIDRGAPIIFKLSDNPPRPPEGSSLWHEMGGYCPSRGDFNTEFDNYAEMDICHMECSDDEDDDDLDNDEEEDKEIGEEEEQEKDDRDRGECNAQDKERDKELYKEMKLTVLEIYRTSLKERQRRKNIIRDYGLINVRRWYGLFRRRYEKSLSLEFFRPFMRLFKPMTFDIYLESLLFEKQLKLDITRLQDYRKNGLTRLGSVRAFHILRQRRETTRNKKHLLQDVLNHIKDENSVQSWLARQAALENPGSVNVATLPLPRKPTPRLNIDGLPGYEKLNHPERELCSEIRLVPQAYLDFSKTLISECHKQGSLRLAQARPLIKIDVNKTRKLYDFLILHGHINKDPL